MSVKKWFDAVFRPHYYAGAKAEDIFEQQAHKEKPPWPMQRISQGRGGPYDFRRVKRADFICRRSSAEVEVKCKAKYEDPHWGCYYFLEYREVMRHKRMKDEVTKVPVVFAFYERKGRSVLEDTLRMVDLEYLLKSSRKRSLYDKNKKRIRVPFDCTREGFEVLDILSKRRGNRQTRRA